MTDEDRRHDELALVSQEAAISVVASVVGVALGPAGAVAGAFLGPFAAHAAKRFRDLTAEVSAAGLDADTIVERLDDDEVLAQLVAEVVRGTVESDLAAKRALLARAAIHALTDDAAVDEESRFVRTAIEVDTFDIRVLAYLGERTETDVSRNREPTVSVDQIARRSPGAPYLAAVALSSLKSAGLAEDPSPGAIRAGDNARITGYGRAFLERLLQEGLEDELRRRRGDNS